VKQTNLQKFISGFKEGLNMNCLPDHILKIENKFYVKIFKSIGAFCIFLSVTKFSYQFPILITYLIYLLSFLYSFYKFFIVFYVIKDFICFVKNGYIIIRNSPFELLTTIGKILAKGVKNSTKATIGTGIAYTLAKEVDDILEEEGKDRYFIPKIHESIASIPGLKENILKFAEAIGIKDSINKTGMDNIKKQGQKINEAIKNLNEEEIEIIKRYDIDVNSLKKTGNYLENLDKTKTSSISQEAQK